VQTEELHDNQKQEDNTRETGVQQVLPFLPQAYSSQGIQVIVVFGHAGQ